ncbi:hypothetical protein [Serratia ficaria]|uniref:hypothetical protein n=1 Tax=Serratia ficaria TaxID=61651 RepID=UPI00217A701C|nr:hypothetical protein [Serratia ficaria]CAI1140878.1 Uncharacterised protein [Serratia ficaria]CAI2515391.1 Uncharacterised protein [Serratia ficaria]
MTKRYNPDSSMSISHEHAWMRETPEGGYVAHGDYATLFSELESVRADRDALAVENAALKDVLESICCRDNEPEYHDCGMGCGLEDRGITDRYRAMEHGWESAMERIYEEVIPFIEDLPETPATDAALAAIRLEAKIEGANELAERIAEMHSKTAPGSNIEKKLMFAAEAAIAYANGLREAK